MSDKPRTIYITIWKSGNNVGSAFESSQEDDPNAPRTPVLYPDLTREERLDLVRSLDAMANFYMDLLLKEGATQV